MIMFSLLIKQVTALKLLYYGCIIILLLLLAEVMVLCLFYLIYLLLLTLLIMIVCFVYSKKYVGICGTALKLIKSYFKNHTQRFKLIIFVLTLLILFVVFLKAQFEDIIIIKYILPVCRVLYQSGYPASLQRGVPKNKII